MLSYRSIATRNSRALTYKIHVDEKNSCCYQAGGGMVEYINTPYYCLSNIVANLLPPHKSGGFVLWMGDKMKIQQFVIYTCIATLAPMSNLNATESNINIQELGMFASSNELKSQFAPIKERIYNYDPTFAQQIESMSDENQLIAVRTWLAEKSFNFYYDECMRMMQNTKK